MENQRKTTTQISYYHAVFGRPAKVKMFFMNAVLTLSYFFRVPIEVIVRKNMGEDYFNILLSTLMGIGFLLFPVFVVRRYGVTNWDLLFSNFSTWYLYTALYIYSVLIRKMTTKCHLTQVVLKMIRLIIISLIFLKAG